MASRPWIHRLALPGLVLLLVAAGLPLLIGPGSRPPVVVGTDEPEPARPEQEPEVGEVGVAEASGPVFTEGTPSDQLDPVVGESGTLVGTVQLGPGLEDEVDAFTIFVQEAINPNRPRAVDEQPARHVRRTWPVEHGKKLHSWQIEGLPFSGFGWQVRVFSPGVNGSQAFVQLGPEDSVRRVHLELTKPTTVNLVAKDQNRVGVPDLPIYLRPSGADTLGRPSYPADESRRTDAHGYLLLEGVLAGEYEVLVGDRVNPVVPPVKVVIHQQDSQLVQLEVPQGGTVVFRVSLPGGWGAPEVQVIAVAKDSKITRRFELSTDGTGKARFDHLPEGEYYFYFNKKGYDQGFRQLEVPAQGEIEHAIPLKLSR